MVDYRSKFTPDWEKAAKGWNLLAEPIDDPNVSNVLFPFARMICTASLTAMSKGRPGFGISPGSTSDYRKVDMLWKPAIDAVMNDSNFDNQQDYFLTDWEVMGNGVYEVFSQTPQRTERIPKTDPNDDEPEYDEIVRPDYRRPKLGVRYRSPYECGMNPFARTPEEAPSIFFHDAMSWEQFVQNYARVKLPDGKYKYNHTEFVSPGRIVAIGNDGTLEYRESDHKGVIVVCYQNEIQDVYRLYANGVLIFDKPLKKDRKKKKAGHNVLGRTSLCFGANWHQYDSNLRTHALYGMGHPALIDALNVLYQAFGNMTVDNMRLANTVPVSFKSFSGVPGTNEEINIKEMYSGYVFKNGGEILATPLGQVSLSNYSWYREFLEDSAMYLGRSNFKQLAGETSSTAYELFQKVQANEEGFVFRLNNLEDGCFTKMGELLLGGVMSDLTVEDYENLTEEDVEEIVGKIAAGETSPDDYENLLSTDYTKEPPRKKIRFMIPTPGAVYKEKPNKDGKYDLESLEEVEKYRGKQTGSIPAREKYVESIEYAERGGIPKIRAEAKHMLGDNQNVKMAKIKLLADYARVRVMEGMQMPELASEFDMQKLDLEMVHALDLKEDDVMRKTDPVAEMNDEVDGILEQISSFLSSRPDLTLPKNGIPSPEMASSMAPGQPGQPSLAPTPDIEGFTPFGSGGVGSPQPVAPGQVRNKGPL